MSPVVLDTNVVSEMQRGGGAIARWLAEQNESDLFTTATTISKLASGISILPQGRRRAELELWLEGLVHERFHGRVLPFDAAAGLAFGRIVAMARSQGRPPQMPDAQIAAIAADRLMPLATRNVRDFAAFGISIVNPWDHPS